MDARGPQRRGAGVVALVALVYLLVACCCRSAGSAPAAWRCWARGAALDTLQRAAGVHPRTIGALRAMLCGVLSAAEAAAAFTEAV